jgi:hypothetical protein
MKLSPNIPLLFDGGALKRLPTTEIEEAVAIIPTELKKRSDSIS